MQVVTRRYPITAIGIDGLERRFFVELKVSEKPYRPVRGDRDIRKHWEYTVYANELWTESDHSARAEFVQLDDGRILSRDMQNGRYPEFEKKGIPDALIREMSTQGIVVSSSSTDKELLPGESQTSDARTVWRRLASSGLAEPVQGCDRFQTIPATATLRSLERNSSTSSNPGMDASVTTKDLYQTLQQTRNFEIGLFWQRSNYFLVLNSGLALGYFNLWPSKAFAVAFAAIGVITSGLWVEVCLGGKYWQTRWEQRLQDFELAHLPEIEFFGATRQKTDDDVRRALGLGRANALQDFVYREMVQNKPSVSYSMIRLAALFTAAWIFALAYAAIR